MMALGQFFSFCLFCAEPIRTVIGDARAIYPLNNAGPILFVTAVLCYQHYLHQHGHTLMIHFSRFGRSGLLQYCVTYGLMVCAANLNTLYLGGTPLCIMGTLKRIGTGPYFYEGTCNWDRFRCDNYSTTVQTQYIQKIVNKIGNLSCIAVDTQNSLMKTGRYTYPCYVMVNSGFMGMSVLYGLVGCFYFYWNIDKSKLNELKDREQGLEQHNPSFYAAWQHVKIFISRQILRDHIRRTKVSVVLGISCTATVLVVLVYGPLGNGIDPENPFAWCCSLALGAIIFFFFFFLFNKVYMGSVRRCILTQDLPWSN